MSHLSVSQEQQATEIGTFVLLDLESTGLGDGTCITELSLVSYTREEFLSRSPLRVCNKLLLCMDPDRPITPGASEISGLSNERLRGLPTFSNQASVIVSLLRSFQSPVCLIAHNGDRFDFPLLKVELKKCQKETLIDDMLCADSIEAFKYLDMLDAASTDSFQSINSSNPLKRGSSLPIYPNSQAKLINLSPANPETPNLQKGYSNGHKTPVPKKNGKLRKSYSLPKMYQQQFRRKPDSAHTAEGDCLTLLKLIRHKDPWCAGFVSWCDENAQPFRNVKPLYNIY